MSKITGGNPNGFNPLLLPSPANELGPKTITAKDNVLTLVDNTPTAGKRRVSLIRDHVLEYPDLFLEVFIQGPEWENKMFAEMLARARCTRATRLEDADLVIFTGGEDVDPALYGETRHPSTHVNSTRDSMDMDAYVRCYDLGVPMLGICRGAQFLHVMNGGKLWQDIDGHQGTHSMWDVQKSQRIERVSSVHHQAVIPSGKDSGFKLIAVASESKHREKNANPKDGHHGNYSDVEAFFYADTCCIGIQGHPEYAGCPGFTRWSLELINELICMNPDVCWTNKNRRLRGDIIDARNKLSNKPRIKVNGKGIN